MKKSLMHTFLILLTCLSCSPGTISDPGEEIPDNTENEEVQSVDYTVDEFVMGADLSYVNQVLDYGGIYKDEGSIGDPYEIFREKGTNLVRLRLFHTPSWTAEVYEGEGNQLYNDIQDVAEAISRSHENGMAVNLDFHYSDVWADPGHQSVPAAWHSIESLEVLQDSVYNYTYRTLEYLNNRGLMPEMVQIGNETNCGMLLDDAPETFPELSGCDGNWQSLVTIYNNGIQAVRDISEMSETAPQIILHVAQPENVQWFFDNLTAAGLADYDILGFSYYDNWSNVSLVEVSDYVSDFKSRFDRRIMILETAYPFTMENDDDYGNILGSNSLAPGYPATEEGQKLYMISLIQEIIDGGGEGVMYWEPAWITSSLRDLWGQGSSWENNAFFDYDGDALPVFDAFTHPYEF